MTTLTPWAFLLAVLAAYRISRIIVLEDGPLDVFARVRGRIDPAQKTWVGRGLACVICVSFWVSLIIALIIGASWLEWLAMSAAIVLWREVIVK